MTEPRRTRTAVGPQQTLLAILLLPLIAGGAAAQTESLEAEQPTFTPVAPLGETIIARPGAGSVLDLRACLEQALAGNDSLLAERERRAELEGQKYQALSTGLPSVDLVGDWTRRRDPSFALDPTFGGGEQGMLSSPPGADPWFDDFLAGFGSFIPAPENIPAATYWTTHFDLNWEINPVKIIGAVGAANLGLERQDLLIRAAEHATAVNVIASYHVIISLAEAVNALEAQYANQRELLELTKMRYDLGFATRLDTLQAAVALANIEPNLRDFRQRVATAGSRLNAVMGRDPARPITIRNQDFLEDDAIDREGALDLATTRPELEAIDRFVGMLERQRQVQGADMLPYLSFFGSYGWVGTDFSSQWDDGHESWTAAAALNIPLFNGLFTKGQVDQTSAQIRRTEYELSGFRRQAQVQVLQLINQLETARENLRAADLNLERAEEALAESQLMYRLGKANYLDVLNADADHLTARRNVIAARFDVLTLTANLKRAVGASPLTPLAAISGLVAADR
jgi:outer membrane protein TolC